MGNLFLLWEVFTLKIASKILAVFLSFVLVFGSAAESFASYLGTSHGINPAVLTGGGNVDGFFADTGGGGVSIGFAHIGNTHDFLAYGMPSYPEMIAPITVIRPTSGVNSHSWVSGGRSGLERLTQSINISDTKSVAIDPNTGVPIPGATDHIRGIHVRNSGGGAFKTNVSNYNAVTRFLSDHVAAPFTDMYGSYVIVHNGIRSVWHSPENNFHDRRFDFEGLYPGGTDQVTGASFFNANGYYRVGSLTQILGVTHTELEELTTLSDGTSAFRQAKLQGDPALLFDVSPASDEEMDERRDEGKRVLAMALIFMSYIVDSYSDVYAFFSGEDPRNHIQDMFEFFTKPYLSLESGLAGVYEYNQALADFGVGDPTPGNRWRAWGASSRPAYGLIIMPVYCMRGTVSNGGSVEAVYFTPAEATTLVNDRNIYDNFNMRTVAPSRNGSCLCGVSAWIMKVS